jgi:hypothetical protein
VQVSVAYRWDGICDAELLTEANGLPFLFFKSAGLGGAVYGTQTGTMWLIAEAVGRKG